MKSRNLLEPDPTGQWDPRNSKIFFSASVIWGAIGPDKMFGPKSLYHPLLYFFIVGIFLPVPFWWMRRRWPDSRIPFHLVNIPIIANGAGFVPQVYVNLPYFPYIVSIDVLY